MIVAQLTNESFRRLHPKEFEKLTDGSTDMLQLEGICLGEAKVFDYGIVSVGIVDGKVVGAFVEGKWRTIRAITRSAASKLAASACAIGVDIDMFESACTEAWFDARGRGVVG